MLATQTKVSDVLRALMQENMAFALYNLPGDESYHLMVSYRNFRSVAHMDFEELEEGFAFVPYSKEAMWFLPADFHAVISQNAQEIDLSEFKAPLSLSGKGEPGFTLVPAPPGEDQDIYGQKVQEIINYLQEKKARKVVLSRRKHLGKVDGEDYLQAFQKLSRKHPDALVNLVYFPDKEQIWLGATPETLVKQDSEGVFTTMSLAGTQSAIRPDGSEIKPIDALWTHKEIEEQAIVGRYIINCLKKIRVREFEEEGPKTVRAGKLLHLRTFYSINNKEVNFPNLSSVMLELLHPTPAICGMPNEAAEEILSQVEGYDREFYSGYLGPVNVNFESHLFVNLRTVKIENGQVYAYAGGGITEDSHAGKEWWETELKMGTIQGAFDNFE
jgi:isochorismate synthase